MASLFKLSLLVSLSRHPLFPSPHEQAHKTLFPLQDAEGITIRVQFIALNTSTTEKEFLRFTEPTQIFSCISNLPGKATHRNCIGSGTRGTRPMGRAELQPL
jgi:hypothetical protein